MFSVNPGVGGVGGQSSHPTEGLKIDTVPLYSIFMSSPCHLVISGLRTRVAAYINANILCLHIYTYI